jgi:hypothetical protein
MIPETMAEIVTIPVDRVEQQSDPRYQLISSGQRLPTLSDANWFTHVIYFQIVIAKAFEFGYNCKNRIMYDTAASLK